MHALIQQPSLGSNESGMSVMRLLMKEVPLITDVVAIKYSELESSCVDKNLSAEISA